MPGPIVTSDVIDIVTLRAGVVSESAGALVEFCGIVRNHDHGRDIRSLDYEAHPTAQQVIEQCCRDVSASTGLPVIAAHRIGPLQIGDVALYAAVAASHRKEAFDACEELVEKIKRNIPIWKRQYFPDGVSEWVGL
ncbi:molybdenum cofactor biosynthesis protein MoaE [Microbacterium kribbense]|uniref:Molybdenum cofactor biosynthesis protein MoaE n=1 Tax=Microbacterium kribbense TaxID=433645 RepID=A0ABP7GK32_9MICO